MLANQHLLDYLAGRIKTAYGLRSRGWRRGCSTTRVWHAAAQHLWEAYSSDPDRLPLDAELFIASQPISDRMCDPWVEIAHPESIERYRSTVRRIVRQLRSELKKEVEIAERCIRRGEKLDAILDQKHSRISALGWYIVAQRAGRWDVADDFATAAAAQHRSCPLYRNASRSLISSELYPGEMLVVDFGEAIERKSPKFEFALHSNFKGSEN